ncbi:MAG: RloB domain-containing protein [Hydrogenophilales bacterium]|nr:RloB domain-containing protein [Hydrogenophilales bacterium]
MARSATPARRTVLKTVLIVGEGDTEKAFLDHLKRLYVTRGCGVSVTVRNAHGKGPGNVIDATMRHAKNGDFDIVAVLMDTDLPWTDEVRALAREHRICMVGATPCVDGLLLQILGERVPAQSNRCKSAFHARLGRKPFVREAYEPDFSKPLLDKKSATIPALGKLLGLMAGQLPLSD